MQKSSLPTSPISGATEPGEKKKMRRSTKILMGVVFLMIVGFGLFSFRFFAIGKDILENPNDKGILNQIGDIVSTVTDDKKLKGEASDRINILLIGMGGENDRGGGAYLTDTIILASIQPKEKKVALMSIPRDLYVKIPGYWTTKINAAYALPYAENNDEYDASQKSIEVISAVTGQTIPYYVRVDFDGFKELVDSLGGVEIDVENSFIDYQYPTPNLGWEKIAFTAGPTKMKGDIALKFARSRHAAGEEGSDFARAKRQQKLLEAIKEKALSNEVLLDPTKINGIMTALQKHIGTNLELWEINRLAKMASEYDSSQIINRVIDNTNLVETKNITQNNANLSIVAPKAGTFDYSDIQTYAANIFEARYLEDEAATIEVYNGTGKSGFAQQIADDLVVDGYKINKVANAPSKNFDTTVIYDRSGGKKPYTLSALVEKFGGHVSNSDLSQTPQTQAAQKSQSIAADTTAKTVPEPILGDIVVILGKDYYALMIEEEKLKLKAETSTQSPSSSITPSTTQPKPDAESAD